MLESTVRTDVTLGRSSEDTNFFPEIDLSVRPSYSNQVTSQSINIGNLDSVSFLREDLILRLEEAKNNDLVKIISIQTLLNLKLNSAELKLVTDLVELITPNLSSIAERAPSRRQFKAETHDHIPIDISETEIIGTVMFAVLLVKYDETLADLFLKNHQITTNDDDISIKAFNHSIFKFISKNLFEPNSIFTELLIKQSKGENLIHDTAVLRGFIKPILPYLNKNYSNNVVDKPIYWILDALRTILKKSDMNLAEIRSGSAELSFRQERVLQSFIDGGSKSPLNRKANLARAKKCSDRISKSYLEQQRRKKVTSLLSDIDKRNKWLRQLATFTPEIRINEISNIIFSDSTIDQQFFENIIELLPTGLELFIDGNSSPLRKNMVDLMPTISSINELRNDSVDMVILWGLIYKLDGQINPEALLVSKKVILDKVKSSSRWSRYSDDYKISLLTFLGALIDERINCAKKAELWPRLESVKFTD